MKKLIYFLSVFTILICVPSALAESGTLTIDTATANSFVVGQITTGQTLDFVNFSFFTTGYNRLSKIQYTSTQMYMPYNSNSTTFTIISGGTGTGTFYYTSEPTTPRVNLTWIFYNAEITAPVFKVSYDTDIITGYVCSPCRGSTTGTTDTAPTESLTKQGLALGGNYITQTSKTFSNTYVVTYPNEGFFKVVIDKTMAGTLTSLIRIMNVSADVPYYYNETAFNNNSFIFMSQYYKGIRINMSDTAGNRDSQIVNFTNSGVSPPATPVPPPTINPIAGVGIGFDKSQYIINDNINMTWAFSDSRWAEFGYKRIDISINGNEIEAFNVWNQTGYFVFPASRIGEVLVVAKTCIIACADIYSARVNIVPEGNSWITLSNNTQNVFGYTNVTYHVGYSTAGYVPGLITIEVRDKSNGNLADVAVPSVFPDGTVSVCGTSNSTRTCQEGEYSVELRDALKGLLDKKTLIVVRNPDTINRLGILVSNVTLDKNFYFLYDFMTVTYVVDDINFTNYSIRGEIYNNNKSIPTKRFYSVFGNQTGQFDSRIDNNPLQKCDQQKNCWVDIGLNSFRLIAYNSTYSTVITQFNFTVSSTTTDGYGLIVSNTKPFKGEAFIVKTIVPAGHTATLKISDSGYANNYSLVNQVVQEGTNTYPVTISRVNSLGVGYYDVILYGDDGRLKVKVPITVTTQVTEQTQSQKKATDTVDLWVGLLGMGINDISKFIFATLWVVVIAMVGLLMSKGNLWGAIVLGFFPFAFFAFIAYIPHWVIVLSAIIVSLKAGWFK